MKDNTKDNGWTFFTNYGHVLIFISQHSDATLRKVSEHVGITERATHRIVGDLEQAGFLRKRRQGRRNYYEVNTDMPLRHPLEEHCSIRQIIDTVVDSKGQKSNLGGNFNADG